MPDIRERNDLVLMPRQFAFVKDMTKGFLSVLVGPYKTSLSETDQLVIMDKNGIKPQDADQRDAIQGYVDVNEGQYVVLKNPTKSDKQAYPEPKRSNDLVELNMGRQINLPGPLSFPLWPFRSVNVIEGHQLRLNQFLVVRVINDVEAQKNWTEAIIKPQTGGEGASETLQNNPAAPNDEKAARATGEEGKGNSIPRPATLSVGQLIIIKGTQVSFYIPPTGLEVVPDENRKFVREAVTLEQLEYCVLVDQNGKKRYVNGPSVVFPTPTEQFVVEDNKRKFNAIELTENSGVHVKVTEAHKDEDGEHKVGDELFITGTKNPIYYPRAEHAIVKYEGRGPIHFATAVPKGEGRYVLNRTTGEVKLVRGPKMLLPDPRTEVIVRRILTPKQISLWYPGNDEALRVNQALAQQAIRHGTTDYVAEMSDEIADMAAGTRSRSFSAHLAGDELHRKSTYTPPRTITLETKYEGAVQVDIWTGYAALVIDKNGQRKVVEGPETILLEFDQSLAYMELSTGKPKTTDKPLKTAFLRVLNNRVSDIISADTSDLVPVSIKVSYRVNFEGDNAKWFDAENYVKLLCDHARSRIRNMVKHHGIQKFTSEYIDLIRDTILGSKPAKQEGKPGERPGMPFQENGMRVYDVEILELKIGNSRIDELLTGAQHRAVQDALTLTENERQLKIAEQTENITRRKAELTTETRLNALKLAGEVSNSELELAMLKLEQQGKETARKFELQKQESEMEDASQEASLARLKLAEEQKLALKEQEIKIEINRMVEEAKILASRAEAIKPDLIAALTRFSDTELVEKMAKAMAPMALLGGNSVADVLGKLLKGTGLENLPTLVSENISKRGEAMHRYEQPNANGARQ